MSCAKSRVPGLRLGGCVAAALLTLTLLLASCGGDGETGDQPGTSPTTQPGAGDETTPGLQPGGGGQTTPGSQPGDDQSPTDQTGALQTPQPGTEDQVSPGEEPTTPANLKADADLFSMSVDGIPGCNTDQGGATCNVGAGQSFSVNFHLNRLPEEVSEYEAWQAVVLYSGVTSAGSADTSLWPGCQFPASYFGTPGLAAVACTIGPEESPSTYTGIMATAEFSCPPQPTTGTVAMLHGRNNTELLADMVNRWAEGEGTVEALTINCGAP